MDSTFPASNAGLEFMIFSLPLLLDIGTTGVRYHPEETPAGVQWATKGRAKSLICLQFAPDNRSQFYPYKAPVTSYPD